MILFKQAALLSNYLEELKKSGKKIGFVPTMGALHKGHIALIKSSKNECNVTVCSIFVNPTQFNDANDFEKYPKTIANDILLLETANCDILFLPALQEIYPSGTNSLQPIKLGEIENLLEGKYRPGHFQGVCQVVKRLLDIVQPHTLFLGQKDYQQCLVIDRLIQQLHVPTQLKKVATYREVNGLALSSRNLRLSEEHRTEAAGIFKMLQHIKNNLTTTPLPALEKFANDYLLSHGFNKVDYVAIANADTLQPLAKHNNSTSEVALIAAFIGDVRLIDNIVVNNCTV